MAAALGDLVYFGAGVRGGLLETRAAIVCDAAPNGAGERCLQVFLQGTDDSGYDDDLVTSGEQQGSQPMRQSGFNLPTRTVYRWAVEVASPEEGKFWPKP